MKYLARFREKYGDTYAEEPAEPTKPLSIPVYPYREGPAKPTKPKTQVLGPSPALDPLPLSEAESSVFFAAVRRVQKTMRGASAREVHDIALALALLDLGRDPETGLPGVPVPRDELPIEFDAGQAWRANNPNITEEAQVLEASAQEEIR